jgi:hypothetical protein
MAARPTPEEIRKHRDAHGCGLQESKAQLLSDWRLARLKEINTHEIYSLEAMADKFQALVEIVEEIVRSDD